jgi:uncharacterized NAD(P)/FAD-binding protein YdhS
MPTIAIIGGGFSGTLTALNLLRFEHRDRPKVVLYERGPAIGVGVAYSTRSPVHYLNVPAGNMSAWEQDPQHFLSWLQLRHGAVTGGSFVPRSWYGDYLRDQVDAARARAGELFEMRGVAVTAVHPQADGRVVVEDAAGERVTADRVVLALGNFAPPLPPGADETLLNHPGYIGDVWARPGCGVAGGAEAMSGPDRIAAILPDEPVLLVGTGLTMVDVVMMLHAREHAGRMIAISRHGLLPRPHRSPARPPVHRPAPAALEHWDGKVRSLVRIVREAVSEHAARGVGGGDWRDVIATLRPVTSKVWNRLDERERERFLTRVRSYWEIVRHRAAPEAAAGIADLIAAKQLTVRAGQILSIRPDARSPRLIEATFRPRKSENVQTVRVARVINCLGPQSDLRRVDEPLVKQLLADGVVCADPLGLGVRVSDEGLSVGGDGRAHPGVFVIGPLRKSQHWENTAVPELRKQATDIARRCLMSLSAASSAAWPVLKAGEQIG